MKKIRLILGLFISAFFLYLVLSKVDFKEVIHIIKSVRIIYLIITIFLNILVLYLRSKRWKLILGDMGKKVRLLNGRSKAGLNC